MRTTVRFILGLVGVTAALRGAPAEKPPLAHAMMGVTNGCFVETVAFLDRWKEVHGETWARLLQWGAREDAEVVMGHAVAICEARGALWSWDINYGWHKLPVDAAQREAVEVIAAPVLKRYPKVSARFPTYRHDFPQTPAAAGTAVPVANANPALRDASLVGAALARHRPVNVVRFSYGTGDELRESAAVVFVFHGRYCIYVPEIGTVPFRVRTSVQNIRMIQDLLRRAFPAVTGVRKF